MEYCLLVSEVFVFIVDWLPFHIVQRFALPNDIVDLHVHVLRSVFASNCFLDTLDLLAFPLIAHCEGLEQVFVLERHVYQFFLLLTNSMQAVVWAVKGLIPGFLP